MTARSAEHGTIRLERRYKAALADPGRLVGRAPAGPAPAGPASAVRASAVRASAVPAPVLPVIAPPAPAPRRTDAKAVLGQALGILQRCAEDLTTAKTADPRAAADRIRHRCGTAADALVQLLSRTDGTDPLLETLKDDAIEGEEMLMLLRLEREETAAEDSLTVLLQLKKEISERVAS